MTETQLSITFVNDRVESTLSIKDRGLAYGDGVFETMLFRGGSIPLWPYHRQRLQQGLKALDIQVDAERLMAHLKLVHHEVIDDKPHVHKLIVTRGEGGRGYCPDPQQPASLISQILPLTMNNIASVGAQVHICQQRLADNPALAGLKTLNQLNYVLASRERHETDFNEGLMLSNDGSVIEATARNLFIVNSQQLLTPSLGRCGVAGVMRRLIIEEIAPKHDLKVIEKTIRIDDLALAEELFICNSIHGIWPVTRCALLEQSKVNSWPIGNITKQLQTAVTERFFRASKG